MNILNKGVIGLVSSEKMLEIGCMYDMYIVAKHQYYYYIMIIYYSTILYYDHSYCMLFVLNAKSLDTI